MKSKTRMWITVVLIFLCGLAVGAAGTGYFIRSHIKDFVRGGPPGASERLIYNLTRGMDLTETQREEIEDIIERTEPEFEKMSTGFRESIKEVVDRQVEEVREVLSEEQKKVLDQRFVEFKKRIEEGPRAPRHRWDDRRNKHRPRGMERPAPADSSSSVHMKPENPI